MGRPATGLGGHARRLGRVGLLAGIAAGVGCGGEPPRPAEVALERCRSVEVRTQEGERVVGAEDLAFDRAGRRLIVSAYDRRGAEAAARRGERPANGGLYEIRLSALASPGALPARALIDAAAFPDGFRPHGLALRPATETTPPLAAVVNRGYRRRAGARRFRREPVTIEVFDLSQSPARRIAQLADPAFCAANDLAFVSARTLLVSRDRAACGAAAFWEDVRGRPGGALLRVDLDAPDRVEQVAGAVAFANGVAAAPETGEVWAAATRGREVLRFTPSPADGGRGLVPVRRIALAGGPDNLTVSDGGVLAAIHPNLIRFAAYRHGWGLAAAPSRIDRIDPATGAVSRVLEDRTGGVWPGATVAVETPGRLILGGAVAAGLSICARGAP